MVVRYFLLLTLCVIHFVQAQELTAKKMVIKTAPLDFAWSSMVLGVEHTIHPHTSVQFNANMSSAQQFSIYNANNLLGFGGELQLRKYGYTKVEQGLAGVYVGMYTTYRYVEFRLGSTINQGKKYTSSYVGGGFLLGYQLPVINNKFVIDFYAGGGIRWGNGSYTEDPSILDMNYRGINPKIGFTVGLML